MKIRKIAVNRLHLPDGKVLKNQIVILTNQNIKYRPLQHEEAFVEWIGGDYYLTNKK